MKEIIDFHLHPFINLEDRIGSYKSPSDWKSFIAHLKGLGISKCAGSVIHQIDGKNFQDIKYFNDEALHFRDLCPDFYIPGVHVLANFPEESCRELERMHSEGVKLIGELVPYSMGRWKYSDPSLNDVWKLAAELKMVLSVHPTDIEDMEAVISANPELPVVIAHPGEYTAYIEKIELLKRNGNAYMDICGTGLFRYGMLAYGVRQLGAERFLFATDFPTCSVGMQIGGVESEDLTDAEREQIYSKNARRLLGL